MCFQFPVKKKERKAPSRWESINSLRLCTGRTQQSAIYDLWQNYCRRFDQRKSKFSTKCVRECSATVPCCCCCCVALTPLAGFGLRNVLLLKARRHGAPRHCCLFLGHILWQAGTGSGTRSSEKLPQQEEGSKEWLHAWWRGGWLV